jgi:hypothetical protein
MARKQRTHVYLKQELLEWAEETARRLSFEQSKDVSRNNIIEMALELLKEKMEKEK